MLSFLIFSMISKMTFGEFSQKGGDHKCESCLYHNIRFFIYFMKKNTRKADYFQDVALSFCSCRLFVRS